MGCEADGVGLFAANGCALKKGGAKNFSERPYGPSRRFASSFVFLKPGLEAGAGAFLVAPLAAGGYISG
jgi:hypothetical protein